MELMPFICLYIRDNKNFDGLSLNCWPPDPLVLVPSLFFISGESGVPLEVLGGPLTADNLKEKITKLLGDAKPVRGSFLYPTCSHCP